VLGPSRKHAIYAKAGKRNIEVAIWKDTVRIFKLTEDPAAILIKTKRLTHYHELLEILVEAGKEAVTPIC
jgi:hypothetical protein